MNFKKYLSDAEKVFKFRIKALFPLEDDCMDDLEKALHKYRPVSVSPPTKMMYQTNPLGFTGVKGGEVWMTDIELTVPVTPELLAHDLRLILDLHHDDDTLKVFSESQDELAADPFEKEEGEERVSILANENYEEVEQPDFNDYFGADYNERFLDYVKKVEAERKEAKRVGNVDAAHPITTWAEQPENTAKPSDKVQPKG